MEFGLFSFGIKDIKVVSKDVRTLPHDLDSFITLISFSLIGSLKPNQK